MVTISPHKEALINGVPSSWLVIFFLFDSKRPFFRAIPNWPISFLYKRHSDGKSDLLLNDVLSLLLWWFIKGYPWIWNLRIRILDNATLQQGTNYKTWSNQNPHFWAGYKWGHREWKKRWQGINKWDTNLKKSSQWRHLYQPVVLPALKLAR